jgi:hypothetical protein
VPSAGVNDSTPFEKLGSAPPIPLVQRFLWRIKWIANCITRELAAKEKRSLINGS